MAPSLLPQRRRGRQSEVARKFLEAAGLAQPQETSSSRNQQPQRKKKTTQQSSSSSGRHALLAGSNNTTPTTPQRQSSLKKSVSEGTPRTVSSSTASTSMYSPSLWGSSKRSSSTRSHHSVKTERTLDTYESSSVPSLQQPQPLKRTSAYVGGNHPRPLVVHEQQQQQQQPSTIYEQRPHEATTTTDTATAATTTATRPQTPPEGIRNRTRSIMMFPSASPSSPSARAPPTAIGDEIRTTTSSITTHSTTHAQPQRSLSSSSSLEAHMQQQHRQATPVPTTSRHTAPQEQEEDWESVSTNEISGSYYYKSPQSNRQWTTTSRSTTPTLGQSIDKGIDYLVGGAHSFVQCAAANVPRVRDRTASSGGSSRSASHSPHHSPGRRSLHKTPSVVSGASTEIATNRAVDMALKRVQEIEASRGTAQALVEARQALERLKDAPARPAPSPQPVQRAMPGPPPARFVATKSILSDTTEDEEASGSKEESSSSIPVQLVPSGVGGGGRLDEKVNRWSNQQFKYRHKNKVGEEEQSLPNESLPSSIGVEVDSRGVTKSNPALRAVFEQHTREALQREGYPHRAIVTMKSVAPPVMPTFQVLKPASAAGAPPPPHSAQDVVYTDPVLTAMRNPPPPPPPPIDVSDTKHHQVRRFSMNKGRGRTMETTAVVVAPQPASPVRDPSLDPILCTGSYVSNGSPHDCGESSVMASTVVHPPPNLMGSPSQESSTASPKLPSIQTKSAAEEWISPLTTHLPAMEEEQEEDHDETGEDGQRTRPVIRLPRRTVRSSTHEGYETPTRAQEQSAHDEVARINRPTPAPTTPTSRIHSSPAWASRQRIQERQAGSTPVQGRKTPIWSSRTPSTPTSGGYSDGLSRSSPDVTPGSRIASLRKQLFEKPTPKAALESFVVRRNSRRVLGEPAVDDTSIDIQSVRSAFESRGSGDKPLPVGDDYDSDDDTASVKSLKEKYEEGHVSKRESEVSRVRAMFEANSKPPTKPFASGSSELQQVFSKFQNKAKSTTKVKLQRNLAGDIPHAQHVSSGEDNMDENDLKTRPTKPVVGSSVADRIRAFGGKSPKIPPVAPSKGEQNVRGMQAASPLPPQTRGHILGRESPASYKIGPEELSRSSPMMPQSKILGTMPTPESPVVLHQRSESPYHGKPGRRDTRLLAAPTSKEGMNGSQHAVTTHVFGASPLSTQDKSQANLFMRKEPEMKARASPSTIEEARRSLRSSPVSMRPESVAQRSLGLSDVTDESQIEGELAAIAANDPVGAIKSSDLSVRKLDWFQQASAEVRTTTPADEVSIGNRPITPATPSRVQERIRMLAAASGGGLKSMRHSVEKSPRHAVPNRSQLSTTKQAPMNLVQPKPRRPGRIGESNFEGLNSGRAAPLLGPPNIERATVDSRVKDSKQVAAINETTRRVSSNTRGTSQATPGHPVIAKTSPGEKEVASEENAGKKQAGRDASDSGSEFSDGVTLDLSIAEVSGLTMPTALHSRTGGTSVDLMAEGAEGKSENSSENPAQEEAKRSEASSSQTSEALIPLLNKALRQRPMSDERSMGESFFEARAFLANRWGKSSDNGIQQNKGARDDASAGWDLERIESSFPAKPSNAGDMFEFESEWVPFKSRSEDDPFRTPDTSMEEKKSDDDHESRSITPTRSNKARNGESYLDRRYPPPLTDGAPLQPSYGQLNAAPSTSGVKSVDVIAPATYGGAGSDSFPSIPTISSFDSAERLSRSHLAHHANAQTVRTPSRDDSDATSDLVGLALLSLKPQPASRPTLFGRTHPKLSDPTWEKTSYSTYDSPAVLLPVAEKSSTPNQEPRWKPPASSAQPMTMNPVGLAMQRYGAQHAALLARLRALKEARVRRANAIYARTTPAFPRRVEIDEHSLSTRSSTQFGGSHFLESLVVD